MILTSSQAKRWFALFLLGITLLYSGCSGTSRKLVPAPVLYKDAVGAFKAENYEDAQKFLTQLLEDSPDSKERVMAQLLLADIHYKLAQYDEAKFNYTKFLELYPAHKRAPRAQFYKGMSEYRQIDIALRDQTFTHNAIEEFEKLVRDYPKSSYRKAADQKLKECKENLAQNLLEIGKFYYRSNSFQSAITRFKSLLGEYPKIKYADEALFLLGESYYREQNYNNAKEFYKRLLREHPRSEFVKEARARLREIR